MMSVLMIVFLGMAAFAIDLGYIAYVKGRLQNAADAAALAGANTLMTPFKQWSAPTVTAGTQAQILSMALQSAQTEAVRLASLNSDGNVASLALLKSDITFGFLDQNNTFSLTPPDPRYPNAVQVVLRRDSSANGTLPLFLGPILGTSISTITVTSRATMYSEISSFRSLASGVHSAMLPVHLDQSVWQRFLLDGSSMTTTDNNGNYSKLIGPNGAPELQIYPDNTGLGHFGLVDIGPPATDTPSFRSWIGSGPSPSDIQYLNDNNLLPVSPTTPKPWNAGPGIASTLQADFASIIGLPRFIPISTGSAGGGGTNGTFQIIGFMAVTVSEAVGHGNANLIIAVQPMAVVDPTAYGGSPTGTSPPTFSFQPPRLTQ